MTRLTVPWSRRRALPVPGRAQDAIAVGAYGYATRPGPGGIDELGRRFVEAQGGPDAAFGWLLWRLHRLEEREG